MRSPGDARRARPRRAAEGSEGVPSGTDRMPGGGKRILRNLLRIARDVQQCNHNQVGGQHTHRTEVPDDGAGVRGRRHHVHHGVGVDGRARPSRALEHEQPLGAGVGQRDTPLEGVGTRRAGETPTAPARPHRDHTGRDGVLDVVAGGVAAALGPGQQAGRGEVDRGRVDQLRLVGAAAPHGHHDRRAAVGGERAPGRRQRPSCRPACRCRSRRSTAWTRGEGAAAGGTRSRCPCRRRPGPARRRRAAGGRAAPPPARRRGRTLRRAGTGRDRVRARRAGRRR